MIDQTDKEAEYYRNMVIDGANKVQLLEQNIFEMQEQIQNLYITIQKKNDMIESLEEQVKNLQIQLNIQDYWESDV